MYIKANDDKTVSIYEDEKKEKLIRTMPQDKFFKAAKENKLIEELGLTGRTMD